MIRGKTITLVLLIITTILMFQPSPVAAHSPGPMTLTYDYSSQTLTIDVTHSTSDSGHYIYEIVIEKNSVEYHVESYTSQSDSSGLTDTFDVTAVDGDVLTATAKCSISGQVVESITVDTTDSTTTSTDTTTDPTAAEPPTIMVTIVVFLAVAFAIFVVFSIRKSR